MEKTTLLVDVRSPEEYATGKLLDAVNIPYTDIIAGLNTGQVVPHDAQIVLYCRSGRRSGIAKADLEKEGYTNVTDLGSFEAARTALKISNVPERVNSANGF